MLRYYSYYNVGGFKDMFLGDSTMSAKSTFFTPLLAVWKRKASEGDTSVLVKIEAVENLPKINLITNDSSYGFPEQAVTLVTHAGYKVNLSSLSTGECIFSIRDIDSNDCDESGRAIPFLLLVVGTTDTDRIVLEKLAAYTVSHLDEISNKFAKLFSYNPQYNAIEFSLQTINKLIEDISTQNSNSFRTLTKTVVVDCKKKDIALFAIPQGLDKAVAIREQNVKGKSINFVVLSDVLPFDNPERMERMLAQYQQQRESSLSKRKFYLLIASIITVATILCFFLEC